MFIHALKDGMKSRWNNRRRSINCQSKIDSYKSSIDKLYANTYDKIYLLKKVEREALNARHLPF